MGDLERLLEKTEIKFPKELSVKEVENLFLYISRQIRCNINYSVKKGKSAGGSLDPKNAKIETYDVEINGMIFSRTSLGFNCYDADFQETKLAGMRFITPPGYDLEELPKEQVAFMDEIREKVNNYFLQST